MLMAVSLKHIEIYFNKNKLQSVYEMNILLLVTYSVEKRKKQPSEESC